MHLELAGKNELNFFFFAKILWFFRIKIKIFSYSNVFLESFSLDPVEKSANYG